MKNYCLYFLLISFILSGCRSKQLPVTDFVPMTSPVAFEGTYLNKGDTLSSLFDIGGYRGLRMMRDSIQFITFKFNGKDTLKLSYLTDAGLKEKSYKGKLKNNFFEIQLKKKFFMMLLKKPFVSSGLTVRQNRLMKNIKFSVSRQESLKAHTRKPTKKDLNGYWKIR